MLVAASGSVAVKVVIADDHQLLRAGLKRLFRRSVGIEVVGEAGTGEQTLDVVSRAQPDLLILDLWMPETDPFDLIATMRERAPALRVIVMTGDTRNESLRRLLAAGVAAIVHKISGFDRLAEAIVHVAAGGTYIDPDLPLGHVQPALPQLTAREQQILVQLARGAAYRDIGAQLQISTRTVETYRRRLGDKLGLRTRADLTRFALQHGLLAAT